MAVLPTTEQIHLYRSLFKGREDVFAVHWEKGKKSGYMPAYRYDPYLYRIHKMKGDFYRPIFLQSHHTLILFLLNLR